MHDRGVCGASFSTGGVCLCDIANRRSVGILYIIGDNRLYRNPLHPLYSALHAPYVPVIGLYMYTHRYILTPLVSAEPCFIPLSV